MSKYQSLTSRISNIIEEVEELIKGGALAKDRSMEEYILNRLQYFKYRYSFLDLPIREADQYEINSLRKKLKGGNGEEEKGMNQTKSAENTKPAKIMPVDEGFQVTYKKTGKVFHYKYCILAKITYPQNQKLLEKLKAYAGSDPNENKFYIFKEWIADLKEHAIYSDDENVLAEIAEYILSTLGGSIRKVE